jgi:hypothetical protein
MDVYKEKYLKYKNKFLNLRKQIEEFNIINEDQKIKDFIDPVNKNKLGGSNLNVKYNFEKVQYPLKVFFIVDGNLGESPLKIKLVDANSNNSTIQTGKITLYSNSTILMTSASKNVFIDETPRPIIITNLNDVKYKTM